MKINIFWYTVEVISSLILALCFFYMMYINIKLQKEIDELKK